MVTVTTRQSTRVLSVDAHLHDVLAEGVGQLRVHSVFRRVVTLETPAGQLLSLCGRELDDAPWSLRAECDDWAAWAIPAGAAAITTADAITLPRGPRISLTGARVWSATVAPITADLAQLTGRAHALAAVIRQAGVPGGALPGPAPDPFAAAVAQRVSAGLAGIVTAELADRADDVERAAASLLGLGPGLTPAGDDALTGMALVLAQPGSLATTVLPAIRRALVRRGQRTTDLSRATLWAAVAGRGRQRVLDLVHTLVSLDDADPLLLRERAERVIAMGHTSGTDTASGVLAGIELEIQRRGSACLSPQ
jgi:hypothetical protein